MKPGPVIADLNGERVTSEERKLLRHKNLGGIILFARNYRNRAQLQALCDEILDLAGRRILITVDQEGGRVQRFRGEFCSIPPMRLFGEIHDDDPRLSLSLAREAALTMALELRECGVDLSFAPGVDLDYGVCEVIGDRAFHRDPTAVAELSSAWRMGMHDAGMSAVAKHFPGHGAVRGDSHLEVPVDGRKFPEIERSDLAPFKKLIGEGLEAVMTAHVRYERIDPEVPTFSAFWIRTVLRQRLAFDGIVFSDDLTMAGAARAGGPAAGAIAAIEAGCDAVLVCNDAQAALEVLAAVDGVACSGLLERLFGAPLSGDRDRLRSRVDRFRETLSRLSSGTGVPEGVHAP